MQLFSLGQDEAKKGPVVAQSPETKFWTALEKTAAASVAYQSIPFDPYKFSAEDEKGFYKNLIAENRDLVWLRAQYMSHHTEDQETGHQYLRVHVMEKRHRRFEEFLTLKSMVLFRFDDQRLKYELEDRFLLDMTLGDRDLEFGLTNDDMLCKKQTSFYFQREHLPSTQSVGLRFQLYRHSMRHFQEYKFCSSTSDAEVLAE